MDNIISIESLWKTYSSLKGTEQTWLKFEFMHESMPVPDTCKFEEVKIKTEGPMTRTRFLSTQGQVILN